MLGMAPRPFVRRRRRHRIVGQVDGVAVGKSSVQPVEIPPDEIRP
jgi:hypothetical protein